MVYKIFARVVFSIVLLVPISGLAEQVNTNTGEAAPHEQGASQASPASGASLASSAPNTHETFTPSAPSKEALLEGKRKDLGYLVHKCNELERDLEKINEKKKLIEQYDKNCSNLENLAQDEKKLKENLTEIASEVENLSTEIDESQKISKKLGGQFNTLRQMILCKESDKEYVQEDWDCLKNLIKTISEKRSDLNEQLVMLKEVYIKKYADQSEQDNYQKLKSEVLERREKEREINNSVSDEKQKEKLLRKKISNLKCDVKQLRERLDCERKNDISQNAKKLYEVAKNVVKFGAPQNNFNDLFITTDKNDRYDARLQAVYSQDSETECFLDDVVQDNEKNKLSSVLEKHSGKIGGGLGTLLVFSISAYKFFNK